MYTDLDFGLEWLHFRISLPSAQLWFLGFSPRISKQGPLVLQSQRSNGVAPSLLRLLSFRCRLPPNHLASGYINESVHGYGV
jgi:hypothetical protein